MLQYPMADNMETVDNIDTAEADGLSKKDLERKVLIFPIIIKIVNRKPRNRKEARDVDFTKSLENDISDIFAPPKNPKSLTLPVNKATVVITLPEDCHYRPESLVKLFLLPNVMCLGKKGRKLSDEPRQDDENYTQLTSWDNDGTTYDNFDDGTACSDADDPGSLVRQPRQVCTLA
ncbi:hypothetical protein BHE74_00044139 [Ensete ventricosum]|uniref:Condensin complex subunit 2 n=1 Tax=Ensete ventricosum TaxID=4639 RepID=A0A444G1D0_ENSVE|nr:hypothetical protein B296_00042804 [Ensete ventricosum]RWW28680.1 hypothetical protein GW17_00006822 [Ensete ventricosum]RWW49632.1 hypothetical protein BHE74_00044139 [Ensete ventricosum]RZS18122.1 hypothetical protein BHM03_00050346 [Ensete ventricosum]